MQSDVKVEQCDIDAAQAIWHMCDDGPYCTLPSWLTNAFARHRIEASLRQPAPEYGRIHTDGSRSGGQPLTTSTAPDALVERVARAMQAVSRPDVDPDKLTPGPRGSVGLMPVWALYEHMAKAALTAIAPDLPAARIEGVKMGLEAGAAYLDDYAGGHYMAQSCAAALRTLDPTTISRDDAS